MPLKTAYELRTELVRETALRFQQYDEAYPDVGFHGRSWRDYVQQALLHHGLLEREVSMQSLETQERR